MSEQEGGRDLTRFEPSPRWVRAVFENVALADSRRAMLVWEPRRLPVYCFPPEDVRTDLLDAVDERVVAGGGKASVHSVSVNDRRAERAAWAYAQPPPGAEPLAGYFGFTWNAMDAWYEEDDEVFVHPRDPHHRVDVLHSSRHVRVVDRLVRDLAWTYPFPIPECPRIENLVCFFDEQVDAVVVDGEDMPRPQ